MGILSCTPALLYLLAERSRDPHPPRGPCQPCQGRWAGHSNGCDFLP